MGVEVSAWLTRFGGSGTEFAPETLCFFGFATPVLEQGWSGVDMTAAVAGATACTMHWARAVGTDGGGPKLVEGAGSSSQDSGHLDARRSWSWSGYTIHRHYWATPVISGAIYTYRFVGPEYRGRCGRGAALYCSNTRLDDHCTRGTSRSRSGRRSCSSLYASVFGVARIVHSPYDMRDLSRLDISLWDQDIEIRMVVCARTHMVPYVTTILVEHTPAEK